MDAPRTRQACRHEGRRGQHGACDARNVGSDLRDINNRDNENAIALQALPGDATYNQRLGDGWMCSWAAAAAFSCRRQWWTTKVARAIAPTAVTCETNSRRAVGHHANRAQRMIGAYALLGRYITEHVAGLLVGSTHAVAPFTNFGSIVVRRDDEVDPLRLSYSALLSRSCMEAV